MDSFVFPAHPVSVALARLGSVFTTFKSGAGVRIDLVDHKKVIRDLKALRAELDKFEAVIVADAEVQRLQAAARHREDRAYARKLEVYLAKYPHERERAIRLGMKETAHAAFVADGLAVDEPAVSPIPLAANVSVLGRKTTPFLSILGRRKAA